MIGVDVLRWPAIGPFVASGRARRAGQIALLLTGGIVVLHGLFGPQLAPANAATVLTWVHYRGLLLLAIVAAGNLLCGACPVILVRDAARRVHPPRLRWPRRLRGKWMAILLFAGFLFGYEAFDLWADPRATALLALGYVGLAVLVDALFAGAAFCKHLCPIGQFSFVTAALSPLEVRVRDVGTCVGCAGSPCIRGRRDAAPVATRGCELGLFLPQKRGNMDCTFCLDCVRACPVDNVAVAARLPALELLETRRRAGVGRLTERGDIAALAAVMSAAAIASMGAMVAPARDLERWVAAATGISSPHAIIALLTIGSLLIVPAAVAAAAAVVTTRLAGRQPLARVARRYAVAMVPVCGAVWLAHAGFHLLTGALTLVPLVQASAIDAVGAAMLGEPQWQWVGMAPGRVLPLQVGVVLLGTAGSLALAAAVSRRDFPRRAGRAGLPWHAVIALFAGAALWLVGQPMDMRGTMLAP